MEATIILDGIEYTLTPKEAESTPVEREWEILSFRSKVIKDDIWYLKENGLYRIGKHMNGFYTLDNMLNDDFMSVKGGQIEIHSVKRLNDGEIFSVGDKIEDAFRDKSFETILSFELKDGSIWLRTSKEGNGCTLYVAIKYKEEPLFITHDNIPYYRTEPMKEWWSVDNKTFFFGTTNRFCDKDYIIRFSTKESAEKYIEENKPKLKVLFVSEDGIDITALDTWIYIVDNNFDTCMAITAACVANPFLKYFFNKDNRDEYILVNKPVSVTQKEILDYLQANNTKFSDEIITEFFKEKINL